MVVRIAPAGKPPKWLRRPPDAPIIVRVPSTAMHEPAHKVTRFMQRDKRARAWVETLPPAFLFDRLLERTQWRFPALEGILSAPTLRPDGSILSTPGFDLQTGLYLDFGGAVFPSIPEFPTDAEMQAAMDCLLIPFMEFPFKQPYHCSAVLAAVLTLLVRLSILGCMPLFAVRAHKPRSGKGLLINTIAEIGTGRVAPTFTHVTDPDEERKRLLSIALSGAACTHIDNITQPFGSNELDSAITTQTVSDRLLGTNNTVEAPWQTLLFASGNNLRFKGDMVHRVVPIDLNPKEEQPEERTFERPELLAWVHAERPHFVVAALTILRGFFAAGCPKDPQIAEFGGFTQWADLIRHGLVWVGFSDPCGGRATLTEESDVGREALTSLLSAWGQCYAYDKNDKGRTLRSILGDIDHRKMEKPSAVEPGNTWNDLHEALSNYDVKYDGKRLDAVRIGNALKNIEGQQVGVFCLMRKGTYQGVTLWKREPVE